MMDNQLLLLEGEKILTEPVQSPVSELNQKLLQQNSPSSSQLQNLLKNAPASQEITLPGKSTELAAAFAAPTGVVSPRQRQFLKNVDMGAAAPLAGYVTQVSLLNKSGPRKQRKTKAAPVSHESSRNLVFKDTNIGTPGQSSSTYAVTENPMGKLANALWVLSPPVIRSSLSSNQSLNAIIASSSSFATIPLPDEASVCRPPSPTAILSPQVAAREPTVPAADHQMKSSLNVLDSCEKVAPNRRSSSNGRTKKRTSDEVSSAIVPASGQKRRRSTKRLPLTENAGSSELLKTGAGSVVDGVLMLPSEITASATAIQHDISSADDAAINLNSETAEQAKLPKRKYNRKKLFQPIADIKTAAATVDSDAVLPLDTTAAVVVGGNDAVTGQHSRSAEQTNSPKRKYVRKSMLQLNGGLTAASNPPANSIANGDSANGVLVVNATQEENTSPSAKFKVGKKRAPKRKSEVIHDGNPVAASTKSRKPRLSAPLPNNAPKRRRAESLSASDKEVLIIHPELCRISAKFCKKLAPAVSYAKTRHLIRRHSFLGIGPIPLKLEPCSAMKSKCILSFIDERDDDANRTETSSSVQCSGCQQYVHICCVNKAYSTQFEKRVQFERYEEFLCPTCSPEKLVAKVFAAVSNQHRQNAWEVTGPELQTATPQFVEEIAKVDFPDARTQPVLLHMRGDEVTVDFFEKYGFRYPILIHRPSDALALTVPETDPQTTLTPFTYDTVLELCTPKRRVNVIDSRAQERYNLNLSEFVDYITGRTLREQKSTGAILLNVVSLEFADVEPMKQLFEPPAVVRQISWADSCMPFEKKIIIPNRSQVSKLLHNKVDYEHDYSVEYFCLMGAAGSFTDFHVDFGGSCVFYHIMRGKKVFYVAPPTTENMKLYRQYEASESKTTFVDGSDNFFKLMEAAKLPIYRLELLPGNTVLLPAGWIHSVHTPEDSLVFGGNFLNHLCIPTQLQVNAIEEELKYPRSDRYHNFEINCVYAIDDLVYKLRLQEQKLLDAGNKAGNNAKLSCFKQYQVHGLQLLVDFVENNWLKKEAVAELAQLYKLHRRVEKKSERLAICAIKIEDSSAVESALESANENLPEKVRGKLRQRRALRIVDDPINDEEDMPATKNLRRKRKLSMFSRSRAAKRKEASPGSKTVSQQRNTGRTSDDDEERKLSTDRVSSVSAFVKKEDNEWQPTNERDVGGSMLTRRSSSRLRSTKNSAAPSTSKAATPPEPSKKPTTTLSMSKALCNNKVVMTTRRRSSIENLSPTEKARVPFNKKFVRRHAERDGEREESVLTIVKRARNLLARLKKHFKVNAKNPPKFLEPPFCDFTIDHVANDLLPMPCAASISRSEEAVMPSVLQQAVETADGDTSLPDDMTPSVDVERSASTASEPAAKKHRNALVDAATSPMWIDIATQTDTDQSGITDRTDHTSKAAQPAASLCAAEKRLVDIGCQTGDYLPDPVFAIVPNAKINLYAARYC